MKGPLYICIVAYLLRYASVSQVVFAIRALYMLVYIHHILVYQLCIIVGHQLYWFNSRSNSPGSNYGRCVDIFAPGQWIRSAAHT